MTHNSLSRSGTSCSPFLGSPFLGGLLGGALPGLPWPPPSSWPPPPLWPPLLWPPPPPPWPPPPWPPPPPLRGARVPASRASTFCVGAARTGERRRTAMEARLRRVRVETILAVAYGGAIGGC